MGKPLLSTARVIHELADEVEKLREGPGVAEPLQSQVDRLRKMASWLRKQKARRRT
jgi:hypothetical protein